MFDERGRLFGTINIVDALVLVFALFIIPLGYVAYRVFRVPPPRIDRVEPASQSAGSDLRIRIAGRDFRPYLRVWVNKTGEPFSVELISLAAKEARLLIETPQLAEVRLPEGLTAGRYDLYMYDGAREIAKLAGAFSLVSTTAVLEAVVRFPVDESLVPLVRAGDRDLAPPGDGRPPSDIGYAQLASVRTLDKTVTAFALQAGRVSVQMPARMIEAVVTLPAAITAGNLWTYRHQPIRAGDPLVFETPRYMMYGFIVEVHAAEHASAAASGSGGKGPPE